MSKPTGAQILLLIREGKVHDWNSLCRSLGRSPTERNSETFWIAEALQELILAGLVEVEGDIDPPSFQFPEGVIRLTRNASVTQHALGISLPELAKLKRDHSMVIEPFFGVPEKREKHRTDLFVLMPFQASLKPVYEDHMLNVAKVLGLTIVRGDDFFNAKSVMSDIWESICGTRAVIADCTGRNPNVFYEIGLAHTVGKPVILITQNEKDVPFDLRHIRYIRYEYTPRGMKDFEEALIRTLQSELGLAKKQETNINSVRSFRS